MFKKSTCTLIAILLLSIPAWSQSGRCTKTLKEAQRRFENGRIDLVEGMLRPCLQGNNFSKEDEIAAHKLLVNTFLYYNENEKAIEEMTQFLTLNPEYQVDELIDASEFRNLHKAFRTTPIYLFGGIVGGNVTAPNVIRNFSLDNSAISREGTAYDAKLGFQLALSGEIPIIATPLSINPEIQFAVKNYGYRDFLLDFAVLNFQETQTWVQTPVTLRYNFSNSKLIVPYINLGASMQYLLGANATVLREDEVFNESEQTQREVPEMSEGVANLRNRFNYALVGGFGVKFKNVIDIGYITLDFRFSYGLTNVVNADKRISNDRLIYDYLHIDNDFSQNTYAFSIGYVMPKYKPKLLKRRVKKIERKYEKQLRTPGAESDKYRRKSKQK